MNPSEDKYYRVIGERIAIRRKEIGMPQEDLAEAVNVTRVSISNIERGRQRTTIHTLYHIADVLKITIHDLLPKDINEIDGKAVHFAIRQLANSLRIDPVGNEQELMDILERVRVLKKDKQDEP